VRRASLSFLLALFACATHRQSAVQLDESAQQDTQSHAAESVEIHRIEEPSRTTTTVLDFDSAPTGAGRENVAPGSRSVVPAVPPTGLPAALPFHGKLIRLTTTVEERGQVSETTSANASQTSQGAAREALSGKADTERDSKPSLGLPVLGLVLAGIAAAAIFTRGVWLGPLLSFIRGKL
jgi:hypothetical protein